MYSNSFELPRINSFSKLRMEDGDYDGVGRFVQMVAYSSNIVELSLRLKLEDPTTIGRCKKVHLLAINSVVLEQMRGTLAIEPSNKPRIGFECV